MAYDACKTRLKENVPACAPPSMRVAIERINRLEQENERLKRENAGLLQQFVVWQYNAYAHLCEFSTNDFQPEFKEINRLWYVAMGSGQTLAEPFINNF